MCWLSRDIQGHGVAGQQVLYAAQIDTAGSAAGRCYSDQNKEARLSSEKQVVVNAVDDTGKPLAHIGGKKELLRPLVGMGQSPRYFSGHAGAMLARPFVTKSGKAPAGGFNDDHALFDTRIYPGQTAKRAFHLKRPASGHARVRVRLIYRRAFKPLVDKKGWKMDDIVIADKRLTT